MIVNADVYKIHCIIDWSIFFNSSWYILEQSRIKEKKMYSDDICLNDLEEAVTVMNIGCLRSNKVFQIGKTIHV